jgi:hypothetical protein
VVLPGLEVVRFEPASLSRDGRYTPDATQLAVHVGAVVDAAREFARERAIARAESDEVKAAIPPVQPVARETLTNKILTHKGIYFVVRDDTENGQTRGFARVEFPENSGPIHYWGLEAVGDPEDYEGQRALGALVVATTAGIRGEQIMKVHGHEETPENRPGDFFLRGGFVCPEDGPTWGNPGSYCEAQVETARSRMATQYGLLLDC